MERRYETLLTNHFREDGEMAFLTGPRQVGKTTSSRQVSSDQVYINWDNEDDRRLILQGPKAVFEYLGLKISAIIIFDEIHKYPHWKTFLKGFYDTYGTHYNLKILVTGSARLDIYRKGGDSLMGRYFLFHMHPLTVGELVSSEVTDSEIAIPQSLSTDTFQALIRFGGFPQPFIRSNTRFYNRWKRSRFSQVFREDIHDIGRVHEVGLIELLAELIHQRAGQLTGIASLARQIRVSEDTVRRWLVMMEGLYYCFPVRPWSKNISRSLRKEPKYYLRDWSGVVQDGFRFENMVACHLLKSIQWWNDRGYGNYGLYYLRTKDKREVDFLVTRDDSPWFLVEAKISDAPLSRNLEYFQKMTGASHAFQVVADLPYADADCFRISHPVKVPALTFLSQLI